MNQATAYILYACIGVALVGVTAVILARNATRPKHFFRVWTAGGGEDSKRMKRLGASYTWTDPEDKRKVVFPLDLSKARRDLKGGLKFMGDPKTGALLDWSHNDLAWQYMDPKYISATHEDGRVLQIARSQQDQPKPWYAEYAFPAIIVVGLIACIILYYVYQMYKHTGAH